jgi:pilus assembly protein CpaB
MLAPLAFLELIRRQVLIRRRSLAALCVALAVWFGLNTLTAAPPAAVPLLTAARDLPSGSTVAADDLERTRFSPGSVPPTALRDPRSIVGRTLLVPVERGEPLSSAKLLGEGALTGYPGRVAIGLRIPDEDAAALLDPGDEVDLVATDPQGDAEPERLVRDAVVLAVPRPDPDAGTVGGTGSGRLVLFAVPREGIEHVAAAATSHFLTVIWNR